jgi:hypothetical protein
MIRRCLTNCPQGVGTGRGPCLLRALVLIPYRTVYATCAERLSGLLRDLSATYPDRQKSFQTANLELQSNGSFASGSVLRPHVRPP